MNNHLSQEQFAKCFVGIGSSPSSPSSETRHLAECGECREELERFGNAVASLRSAIHRQVEDRVTRIEPAGRRMPRVSRAIAAAAVVLLGMVPLLTSQRPQRAITEVTSETNADALMNAINQHLSRTVPSPMEPMMSLLPSDALITVSGGAQ